MDTYIHQHGRLGDMILCNGLIRHLLQSLEKTDNIYLFCRSRNEKSVKFMYRDKKRIKIIPFNENYSDNSFRGGHVVFFRDLRHK